MTNFEIIREARNAILYEDMNYFEFVQSYPVGNRHKKELKALWKKANEVLDDRSWNVYILNRTRTFLSEFERSINELYETGLDCPDIGASIGIDSKIVRAFL